jgi:hypothetical protein
MLSGSPGSAQAAANPGAATMLDATGTASAATAWTQERETRAAEAARLRQSIAELQQRHGAAKKRVAEAQSRVEAARGERASLEQWFKRQVGTRTAAVEEARKVVRGKLVAIAGTAIADRAAFGAELDATREQIAKLEAACESARRDVQVHEAAIEAYDPRSLKLGVLLLGVVAALLLALVVAPIVWRATRVVEPPRPVPVQPAPNPPAHH